MIKLKRTFTLLFLSFNLVLSIIDFNLIKTSIPKSNGHQYLNKTFIVNGVVDFGLKELELIEPCTEQNENQRALLKVNDGGHVKNLIIGKNAGDGIHCEGSCILENVHWRNVCEDGATFKNGDSSKVMTIIGGSAYEAQDKLFQHNSQGKMVIKNFYAKNIGKLARSCGTCYPNNSDIRRTFEVENVVVDGLKEAIVGLQINKPDEALILRNIQVTNAKQYRNGTFYASICKTYKFNKTEKYSFFYSSNQFPNKCTWKSDVTIN